MNAKPTPSTFPTYVQLTALLVKAKACSIVAESLTPKAAAVTAEIDAALAALTAKPSGPAYQFGWWAIKANNAGAHYGFGYEDEAMEYAAKLNKKREYDRYSPTFLGETDAEATEAAGVPDITTEGVDFIDA